MTSIPLFLNEHKQQERLFAAFDYNKPINAIIKSIAWGRDVVKIQYTAG